MRSNTCIAASAAVLGLLFLPACGGGGGGGGGAGLSEAELERPRSDPGIVRLAGIAGRSDNLVMASLHIYYVRTIAGQTIRDREVERFRCTGLRCVGDQGTIYDEGTLLDPDTGIALTGLRLGSRAGFDTAVGTVRSADRRQLPGTAFTSFPPVFSYGLWGRHGWASVEIADGPATGRVLGLDFTGNLRLAGAHAEGDASGTNPTGLGSATWTGIAEAASTSTLRRHTGIATLTIADLSRPRVDADIAIGGSSIAPAVWSGMPLANGRYEAGIAGTDRIQGDFYGPNHGETYGIFDTDAYVGAFGARRDP